MPRVLFINHSVRDGGPGRSLYYILKYIDRKKIDPYVLVPKEDVFTGLIAKEGLGDRIIVEGRFPENIFRPRFNSTASTSDQTPTVFSGILRALSVTLNVIDLSLFVLTSPLLIKKMNINMIYCNGTIAKIVGALIGVLSRRPVIWHVRNIQQTSILRFTINALSSLSAVKKIICVSIATTSQFRLGREKIAVIHNGIDPKDFNPKKTKGVLRTEYEIPEGAVIIGNTGRVVRRKGYETLIKAAEIIQRNIADEIKGLRFVVVGDTSYFFGYNHLEYLRGLVKELDMEDIFIFTGYKEDVGRYIKDFDIFAIPSSYPDPFPRSVIEAMSFAIPVVGFMAGGIVEAVENGVTGILSEAGDEDGMAEAILRLIRDKSLRTSMGAAGRERVKTLFSAKERAKDIERNILEVARGGF